MDTQLIYLSEKIEAAFLIANWFKQEWPDFFHATSIPDLACQLTQRANTTKIPVMLLAVDNAGSVAGTVSLTQISITTRPHLGPWLSGLYVHPNYRHKGIATRLIQAAELLAPKLGCSFLYAGTSRIQQLFKQLNWQETEITPYHGELLSVFRKDFMP